MSNSEKRTAGLISQNSKIDHNFQRIFLFFKVSDVI